MNIRMCCKYIVLEKRYCYLSMTEKIGHSSFITIDAKPVESLKISLSQQLINIRERGHRFTLTQYYHSKGIVESAADTKHYLCFLQDGNGKKHMTSYRYMQIYTKSGDCLILQHLIGWSALGSNMKCMKYTHEPQVTIKWSKIAFHGCQISNANKDRSSFDPDLWPFGQCTSPANGHSPRVELFEWDEPIIEIGLHETSPEIRKQNYAW